MSEQGTAEQTMQMPKHGEICWSELATTDSEAAENFYRELFGWQFKTSNASGMDYSEISLDGKKQFGGLFQMGKEFGDTPPRWMNYIAVDNIDASAAKVTELGGKICMPSTDIPNVGRFCVVSDPSGAIFSMITMNPRN